MTPIKTEVVIYNPEQTNRVIQEHMDKIPESKKNMESLIAQFTTARDTYNQFFENTELTFNAIIQELAKNNYNLDMEVSNGIQVYIDTTIDDIDSQREFGNIVFAQAYLVTGTDVFGVKQHLPYTIRVGVTNKPTGLIAHFCEFKDKNDTIFHSSFYKPNGNLQTTLAELEIEPTTKQSELSNSIEKHIALSEDENLEIN